MSKSFNFFEFKNKVQKTKINNKKFILNFGYSLHRRLSIYISWFLIKQKPDINADTISFSMLILIFLSAICLFFHPTRLIGFLGFYLAFIFDKVDGEIARFQERYSLKGVFIDEYFHFFWPILLFGVNFFVYSVLEIKYIFVFIILSIFNRLNRKLVYVVKFKLKDKILNKEIIKDKPNKIIEWFFNLFFLRIFAFVERQDIMLLFLFINYIVYVFLGMNFFDYLLIIYLVSYLINICRWFFLYLNRLNNNLVNIRY